MKKIDDQTVAEAREFVTGLLTTKLPDGLVYHSIDHTRSVVNHAKYIAEKEGLSQDEVNMLLVAAWFHDTGYISRYKGHEEVSVEMAFDFLDARGTDYESVSHTLEAIRATEFPRKPASGIAAVLCDADFMHLADSRYMEISELLRQEWKETGFRPLKKKDFEQVSLEIFSQHSFHTNYCRAHYAKQKERNFILLKELIAIRHDKKSNAEQVKPVKQKISSVSSRGVDSMFRMTARNQINLSSIADNKSNILISLNGIIISLGIAFLFQRFEETPEIIAPTIIFLLFSLTTIVLAILSTRPHISGGKFTKEDIRQMKVNLLFFGNFYDMEIDEYEWAIKELINNDKYLYSTMIKDQFYLGKVLARKYKLLRAAYFVFMLGLIISVGIFFLIFIQY